MKKRLYPWIVFGALIVFIAFMSSQGKRLEATNIWVLIMILAIIILGLLFGMLKHRR